MKRPRVLVVDDEPDVLALFERILAPEGVDVVVAERGGEAVALAREHRPHLVVLDLKLPDTNGIDLLRHLRKLDPCLAVLIVTSYGSVETVRAAMRLGAFDYLTKPFDIEEVRRLARAALAARAAGRLPPEASGA